MRRTRLAWRGGSNARRGGGNGAVPYLPDCWKGTSDFSDPLQRREERTSYFCDLCKQQMSSKAAFITHCNSVFHKEKEGSMNKMVSEHEWICHTCEKPFPSKTSLDQHCLLVRHQPMYRIEGMSSGQKDEAKNDVQAQHEKGPPTERKMLLSFGSLKPPYYCEICKVDCLNNSNLKSHCETSKHKEAVERQSGNEEENKGRKEEDSTATFGKKIFKGNVKIDDDNAKELISGDGKTSDYFCDICDLHISCRDNYLDHLNGKKHRKHVFGMRVPFCCIFCDIKFATRDDFNDHYKSTEHIRQASRLVSDKEVKVEAATGDKEKKDMKKDSNRGREMHSKEERDGVRSRRAREGSREKDRFHRRDRMQGQNRYDNSQKGRPSRNLNAGRDSNTRRRSRDREVSNERYENSRHTRGKRNNDADKEERSKRGYKRERSSSPERNSNRCRRSSRSMSIEKKEQLSKEKKEKHEEKTMEMGMRNKGSDKDDEIANVEERMVKIKGVGTKEELGDLREKLNRSVNIVITKKIKNDKEEEEKETDTDANLHDDDDSDLKKDEEIILKHHKADLVLREQLLKEHTLEILKYKDAEEEYRRLFLEEDYLRNRLDLFRDGDPRKDSDAADLERIQRAIRDIREELEIRDVMIQEKERYLIVLKNRIEERTKIISKAEADSSRHEVDDSIEPNVQYVDSASPKAVVKAEEDLPIKDVGVFTSSEAEEQRDQSPNEDGDLRDEIERERILKKLAPGMEGLDFSIRKRIVDALLTSNIPRTELMKSTVDGGKERNLDRVANSERVEKEYRGPDARHGKEILADDSYAKKQAVYKGVKPETFDDSKVRSRVHQRESGSERIGAYGAKEKVDLQVTITKGQKNQCRTTDSDSALETDDFEREWRKRELELRKREDELRKREDELLERERQRKSGEQDHWGKSTTSGRKQQSYSSNKSSSRLLQPEKQGRDSFDEKSKLSKTETNRDNRSANQGFQRASASARRDSLQHNKPSTPKSFSTRKRSRSRSSSANSGGKMDESGSRKSKAVKREHLGTSDVENVVKARLAGDKKSAVQLGEQMESSKFPESFKCGAQELRGSSGFKGALPGLDNIHTKRTDVSLMSNAVKQVRRLPVSQASRKESAAGSGRREQFSLWKSIVPSNEVSSNTNKSIDKTKDDIWDTAFGTGEEEAVDKVAIDIFSDPDMDSDYLKGRLHESRSRTPSKPKDRAIPVPKQSKQSTSTIPTIGTAQTGPSFYSAETHTLSGESAGSSEVLSQLATKTEGLFKEPIMHGTEVTKFTSPEGQIGPRQQSSKPISQIEEKETFVDKGITQAKQVTAQPRGILKRGILKKPTESFDEKPSKKQIKEGIDKSHRPGSSDRFQPERQDSQQGRDRAEELNLKERTPRGPGAISSEDLQKIQVIMDDFKKQFGPNWDSSAIEADLEMVLRRQLIAGSNEKLGEERNQETRLPNTPFTEHANKPDRAPIADSREGNRGASKETLFPIQIPEKVLNVHSGKDFPVVANYDGIKNEENPIPSIVKNHPEYISSVTPGVKSAVHINRPIDNFERPQFRGHYEEGDAQERLRPQLIRGESSSRGMRNERRSLIEDNSQVAHLRDQSFNSSRVHGEARYQEGTNQSFSSQRNIIPGIHPERQMTFGGKEGVEQASRTVGKPPNIPMSDFQRHRDKSRFQSQSYPLAHVNESESPNWRYGGYFNEPISERRQALEKQYQGLDEEKRKGAIPGLTDSWHRTFNEEQEKLTGMGIHNPRILGHFPESGEGQYRLRQTWKQEANIQQERIQKVSVEPDYAQRTTRANLFDKRDDTQGEVISKLSQPKDPSQLLPSRQLRQADPGSDAQLPLDDLQQHIYKTVNEDVARGMFYCACCQVFLANENERATHSYSEIHRRTVKTRNIQQPFAFQSTAMIRPIVLQRQVHPTQPVIYDTQQYRQHAFVGQRAMQPARLYALPQNNQPRSLGNIGPRYA